MKKASNSNILYSFRRCPYAIRARFALILNGIDFENREVDLKNKPNSLFEYSPKGTVPVLITSNNEIIDESLDIVSWSLSYGNKYSQSVGEFNSWLDKFIPALNRYKYPDRFKDSNDRDYLKYCCELLHHIENTLNKPSEFLLGNKLSAADIAVFPFIRQFMKVDDNFFLSLELPKLKHWLDKILNSKEFILAMEKKGGSWKD